MTDRRGWPVGFMKEFILCLKVLATYIFTSLRVSNKSFVVLLIMFTMSKYSVPNPFVYVNMAEYVIQP